MTGVHEAKHEQAKRKTKQTEGMKDLTSWDSEGLFIPISANDLSLLLCPVLTAATPVFSFEGVDPSQPLSLEFKLKARHALRKDPLLGKGSIPIEALMDQEPGVPRELEIGLGSEVLSLWFKPFIRGTAITKRIQFDISHPDESLGWRDASVCFGLDPSSAPQRGLESHGVNAVLSCRSEPPETRLYCIDRSGSMAGGRWRRAEQALTLLAPMVCKADPDGISLYFFNNQMIHFENVSSAGQVNEIFAQNQPCMGTEMAGPLKAAIAEHFSNKKMATTILVISDGEPSDKEEVKACIIAAAKKIKKNDDLSITFIQCGGDAEATSFLMHLDDELDTKFDIVDTLTSEQMMGMEFSELIEKSIAD